MPKKSTDSDAEDWRKNVARWIRGLKIVLVHEDDLPEGASVTIDGIQRFPGTGGVYWKPLGKNTLGTVLATHTVDNDDREDGAHWAHILLQSGLAATINAMARLVETPDMRTLSNLNFLSGMGNAVSLEVRRLILIYVANHMKWSLVKVAEELGFSDETGVLRAFKDVAADELNAARRDGRIKRGPKKDP